jgi:hypothetical protein
MRTYFIITDQELAASKDKPGGSRGLIESRAKAMGPYAHDFGNPIREQSSNSWRVSFDVPADPSWCLL